MSDDYTVTVCSECLRASCWHGDFPCGQYASAGTVQREARHLRALNLEHPDHFSRDTIVRVCGALDGGDQ